MEGETVGEAGADLHEASELFFKTASEAEVQERVHGDLT